MTESPAPTHFSQSHASGRRLLLSARNGESNGETDSQILREFRAILGEPLGLNAAIPGAEKSLSGDQDAPYYLLVIVDPAAPGVISRFFENGQTIDFGATLQELTPSDPAEDAHVVAEFRTFLERIAYRHRLEFLETNIPALAPHIEAAALRLSIKHSLISHDSPK